MNSTKVHYIITEAARHKPQFDICPIGLAGAGKTTVLNYICDRLPMVRISGDDMRHALVDAGLDPENAPALGARLNIELKRAGYNIAQDNDLASAAIQAAVRAIDQELAIREFWIHIAPPEAFILNKLQNFTYNEKTYYWLFQSAEQARQRYFERKAVHESDVGPQVAFDYTFDTSLASLPQQVDEFVRHVQRELAVDTSIA